MDSDIVIKVEGVSKKFCRSLKKSMLYGALDIARNAVGVQVNSSKLRHGEFWAVQDLSFEVRKGEVLGIIGLNGSGKTTLLKMLNGIFWPDAGKITIKGRVGALIAAGVGFHPNLTGRENVYISGAIMGMSRHEVDRKMNDIIAFADIGDFIDVPVMFYSSGMMVRLGFASAVFIEPEILLVDEVMAVGDINFKKKAAEKLSEIRKNCTIIYISHYLMEVAAICDRALWMEHGQIMRVGAPSEVIAEYVNFENKGQSAGPGTLTHEKIEEFEAIVVDILDASGKASRDCFHGDPVRIAVAITSSQPVRNVYLQLVVTDRSGALATVVNSFEIDHHLLAGQNLAEISLPKIRLIPGEYSLFLLVINKDKFIQLAKVDCGKLVVREHANVTKPNSGYYREDVSWIFQTHAAH